MTKEKEIGKTFAVKGKRYTTIAVKTNSCHGCAFERMFCVRLRLGPCGAGRSDNQYVIFKPVEP